jgi:hypothetical protein
LALQIVLVWHDPPSDMAVEKNLVNDLDVMVRSAGLGGATILGNGDRDDTNNVEMIHLSDVAYGTVVVTVTGAHVPQGPQPYSLVVLGQFSGTYRQCFGCLPWMSYRECRREGRSENAHFGVVA